MVGLLSLLILFALFLQGAWSLWPNRSLFWLISWKNRKYYRLFFNGLRYQIDSPCIIIAENPSLLMASLIKRVSSLSVTFVVNEEHSPFIKKLSLKSDIHALSTALVDNWSATNVLLISCADHARLPKKGGVPIFLAALCGENGVKRASFRLIPQELQLSVRRVKNEAQLHTELQYFGVYAYEHYIDRLPSIVELWLRSAKAGGNQLSVADSTGTKLTHHRLITAVITMRAKLFQILSPETHIAVCLPASVGCVTALLTLLSLGKTIVNLNYTASKESLQGALEQASIKIVISSRRFLENLDKKGFAVGDVFSKVTVILLEEVRAKIDQKALFKNYLLVKLMPFAVLRSILVNPISPSKVATILFSSGSEGKPKGVELTHRNIVGNAKQAAEALSVSTDDVMLGILPVFHAFGLTATTLLPLIEGICVVCHPDPTDAGTIGELAKTYHATVLCGTSTFFRLYAKARNLEPEMFASLRFVVAGAEKLLPEVRTLFEEKFKKKIYEGYGTTELSPVATVNQPDTPFEIRHKVGTVGRAIAGAMIRILDPDTNEALPLGDAGMVAVGGVNVMRGYLNNRERTHGAILHDHGIRWYKTGDKGRLDERGFLTILDRYSRFAKLGGEMIGLGIVEEQITILINDPDVEILAVAIPDIKKGEQIVLMVAGPMSADDIQKIVQHSHLLNLMKPAQYWHVEAVPKLGTGKTDFARAKQLVLEHFGEK